MSTLPPPISLPASRWQPQAEHWGHALGCWAARLRLQTRQAQYVWQSAEKFWRHLQSPQGRKRNIGWLLGGVVAAGLVLGLTLGRRG